MFLFSFLRVTRFNRLGVRQLSTPRCRRGSSSESYASATMIEREPRAQPQSPGKLRDLFSGLSSYLLEKLALSGAERCQRISLASPGARESYAEWRVEGLLYRGSQERSRSLACCFHLLEPCFQAGSVLAVLGNRGFCPCGEIVRKGQCML